MRRITCSFILLFCAFGAWATESIPGVSSHYVEVEVADGSRLQSIISLPDGDSSPRHPILFTQWVSCGSLQYREGSNSMELLAALARNSDLRSFGSSVRR
ncbi:MAG: hypothetical protein QNJ14_18755 [Woeseiaceae bacterium]|nr:hypothetical protein [Woeseiaceae bacterium]